MTDERPVFGGVHIFFRDFAATADFYRRLGLELMPWGEHFARAMLPNGQSFEFGSAQLSRAYDPGWREPSGATHQKSHIRRNGYDQSVFTAALPGARNYLTSMGYPARTPVRGFSMERAVQAVVLGLGFDPQADREIDSLEHHERDHGGPRAGRADRDRLLPQ